MCQCYSLDRGYLLDNVIHSSYHNWALEESYLIIHKLDLDTRPNRVIPILVTLTLCHSKLENKVLESLQELLQNKKHQNNPKYQKSSVKL